jgi:hypothetical protein
MTLRIDPQVRGDHVHLAASLQQKQEAVRAALDREDYVRAGAARIDLGIFVVLYCEEVA